MSLIGIARKAAHGPIRDTVLENSFAVAEAPLGLTQTIRPWSLWVKLLRWLASHGKASSQAISASGNE